MRVFIVSSSSPCSIATAAIQTSLRGIGGLSFQIDIHFRIPQCGLFLLHSIRERRVY